MINRLFGRKVLVAYRQVSRLKEKLLLTLISDEKIKREAMSDKCACKDQSIQNHDAKAISKQI